MYEKRAARKKWSSYKVIEVNGQEIKEPDSIKCPKGWEWAGNWAVDNRRACDADGILILLFPNFFELFLFGYYK